MASASAVTATLTPALPVAQLAAPKSTGNNLLLLPSSPTNKSLASKLNLSKKSRVTMSASDQKEQNHNITAGLTGLALLAAAVVPEMAEAVQPGVSASLKNLLLSVVAGGVVLVVIGGAVAGVSTFDPVKRR